MGSALRYTKVFARIRRNATLASKFTRVFLSSESLLKEIQQSEQKRDDCAFAGKREEYLYWQGYGDGVRKCLGKVF